MDELSEHVADLAHLKGDDRRLRAILDAEPHCVKLLTRDCRLLDMNPAGLAMIEADSLPSLKGRSLLFLVDPHYRAPVQGLMDRVFQGESGTMEFPITTMKGRSLWLECHAVPLRNEDAVEAALCITRNITGERVARAERDHAVRALLASEAKFRSLVEKSYDAVALISADGKVDYCSPSTENILGYAPEELTEKFMFEYVHLADAERMRKMLEVLLQVAGESKTIVGRARHKNGSWRTIEAVFTNLLKDPTVGALVANYRDITDRVHAEESLRASEERFKKAFRSVPAAISISTLDEGRFVDVNTAFLKMVGYERDEIIGSKTADLNLWLDPHDLDHIVRRISENESVTGVQTRFRTKAGQVREVQLAAEKVHLGDALCLLLASRDVTDERILEQQFRHAQKMEAVGLLAAGVAHDFNNLLSVIMGYSEIVRDRVPAADPMAEHLAHIKGAAERAAALTRQLLAFSRQQTVFPRLLDLNSIVQNVMDMLPRMVGEDISLTFNKSTGLGSVKADQGQVEQILMNLAVNSRDAMPHGGAIVIETAEVELDEEYSSRYPSIPPGTYIMLAVSDNGVGMGVETLAHLFEPFYTTKGPGRGTGLGLSTVKSIVQQNDGHIFVYSEPNNGTVFKIFFPKVNLPSEASPKRIHSVSLGGRETILVAEDEELLRHLIVRILGEAGYQVLAVQNGEEALAILSGKDAVDLVLTDAVMPGMSGMELSKRLSSLKPMMRVVYMSGYSRYLGSLRDVARDSVLEKPFSKNALLQKVRSALDARPVPLAQHAENP